MKGQTRNIRNEEMRRIPTQILESIFNKIIQEKFPNLKDMSIKMVEAYKTPNKVCQKRSPLATIDIQNKEY